MSPTVLIRRDGPVLTISLNRPARLNAINPALLADLLEALTAGNADPAVEVMVLRGEGRAFCAGDDLREFDEQVGDEPATRAYVESIQDITREMVNGPKMVVGAIHGWAVGGGLEWTINCDLAVAAEGTRFFFPEVSWGLFVTGGVSHLLPRMVGLQKTRELILFGERFDARQALGWGLVWKVVPQQALFDEALRTAERIAALPRRAVADLKRCLRDGAGSLDEAMKAETDATVRGFLDPQTARRIADFGSSR